MIFVYAVEAVIAGGIYARTFRKSGKEWLEKL